METLKRETNALATPFDVSIFRDRDSIILDALVNFAALLGCLAALV